MVEVQGAPALSLWGAVCCASGAALWGFLGARCFAAGFRGASAAGAEGGTVTEAAADHSEWPVPMLRTRTCSTCCGLSRGGGIARDY